MIAMEPLDPETDLGAAVVTDGEVDKAIVGVRGTAETSEAQEKGKDVNQNAEDINRQKTENDNLAINVSDSEGGDQDEESNKENEHDCKAAEDSEQRQEQVGASKEQESHKAKESTTTNNNQEFAMSLNVAYEALEQVRKANLAIEFSGKDIENECIPCLRQTSSDQIGRRRRGLRGILSRNKPVPCLSCGTNVCSQHRCSDLSKEHIALCTDCARFYSFDGIVESLITDDHKSRDEFLNNMLDVYDRALLILRYSSSYVDEIAEALRHNTQRNNKIGLTSSATGVLSGTLGVAAAVTIWTPVGPPLLIASILFGGGATAASASSEAVNYYAEPNKMADRILCLQGIVACIARLAGVGSLEEGDHVEVSSRPDATRKNWTRATANALKPLTAGALSAASIVMEAKEMKTTVQKIRAGHPCDKALALEKIKEDISKMPNTTILSQECQKFVLVPAETKDSDHS